MKMRCAIWWLLLLTVLSGCTLLPGGKPVEQNGRPEKLIDLFDYAGKDYHLEQVLIRTANNTDVHSLAKKYGSYVIRTWSQINWTVLAVPAGETVVNFIERLRQDRDIYLAEPNFQYMTAGLASSLTGNPRQWALEHINVDAGWQVTTGSEQVLICIMDTGVQMDHPEFAGKNFVAPYDATGESLSDVTDYNGHGTHVAGIAGADGRNGQMAGIAWDCPIMPVRVAASTGEVWNSALTGGLLYVVDFLKSHPEYRAVVNMSMCSTGYSFALKDAIDYALEAGVLVVAAGGDTGKRGTDIFPGAYNGVLAVAASTPFESRADFSTLSEANSIAAPGVLIWSTFADSSYTYLDGTSMAAAYVSGAAALLLSRDRHMTPLELKNQLEQTARGNGFTEELGYGLLDLQALFGPKQEMQYGTLKVQTNIVSTPDTGWIGTGIITVFDKTNQLSTYGTTGETGQHVFHALKSGDYMISLTYYDQFSGHYTCIEEQVAVKAGEETLLEFALPVPVAVVKNMEEGYPVAVNLKLEENYPAIELFLTITAEGYYGFETSTLNGNECNTLLYVCDSMGNLLAVNDNYGSSTFSYVGLKLLPDTYIVILEESGLDADLQCFLSFYSLVVTY